MNSNVQYQGWRRQKEGGNESLIRRKAGMWRIGRRISRKYGGSWRRPRRSLAKAAEGVAAYESRRSSNSHQWRKKTPALSK